MQRCVFFSVIVCDNYLLRTNLNIEVHFGGFKRLIYYFIVPTYVVNG